MLSPWEKQEGESHVPEAKTELKLKMICILPDMVAILGRKTELLIGKSFCMNIHLGTKDET